MCAVEVDVGTGPLIDMIEIAIESVGVISPVDSAVGIRCRGIFCYSVSVSGHGYAYDAFLGTAEDLEDVTFLQVDGGTAPYLGARTVAATEDVHGFTQHVHTLLVDDDAAVHLGDVVFVGFIIDTLALFVLHDISEDLVAVHNGFVDVDDHIAVHKTCSIAAAVDVSALEASVDIVGSAVL